MPQRPFKFQQSLLVCAVMHPDFSTNSPETAIAG